MTKLVWQRMQQRALSVPLPAWIQYPVPQVFINGIHLGGAERLEKYIEDNNKKHAA